MSEVVHYKGKIKLVDKKHPEETLEEQCKRLLGADKIREYYSSYREMLEDVFFNQYVINENNIYEVLSKRDYDDNEGIFNLKDNNDGTYDYDVRYYNGGCCFTEAIEFSFKNTEENKL